jgi:hypothetical protein
MPNQCSKGHKFSGHIIGEWVPDDHEKAREGDRKAPIELECRRCGIVEPHDPSREDMWAYAFLGVPFLLRK